MLVSNGLRLLLFYTAFFSLAVFAGGFTSENIRLSFDSSARISHNPDGNHNAGVYALGLDLHKVFSNDSGDIGTLVFQPYFTRLDNVATPAFFFDDGNDLELIWRIANFNYKVLNNGRLNLKIGHFELPFGLEQNLDTNGTLRQYTFSDRGLKADWGFSVNGSGKLLDYELAFTRGSGNQIKDSGNPYIFSGRLGKPSHHNFIFGGSWLYGEVLGKSGTVRREKLGLDMAYYYHQYEWLFELSAGSNDRQKTRNVLTEVSWRDASEQFHGYVQFMRQAIRSDRWQFAQNWILGGRWLPDNYWDLSVQYAYQDNNISPKKDTKLLTAQIRYRF